MSSVQPSAKKKPTVGQRTTRATMIRIPNSADMRTNPVDIPPMTSNGTRQRAKKNSVRSRNRPLRLRPTSNVETVREGSEDIGD